MRRRLSLAAGCLCLLALAGACGGGDTAGPAPTTAASPTTAPDVVTTDGGYVMAGYRVSSLDAAATGLNVPAGLEGLAGYRYAKDGTEVAVGLQGLLPESESPSDATLKQVLGEVAGGGTPTEIAIGEQSGFEVAGADGNVYIANLLEDGTVNVVRGSDKDAVVTMLVALNTATSIAQ